MAFWGWSRTANNNALVGTVNFQEGQAPSSLNDSNRSLMADLRSWADDVSGAITTGGTSTALTVTSYQTFGSLGNLANQVIAFTPHATNGATVTLNVDGLGAKPLRSAPSVELPAGVLVQGTPYTCLYNSSDQVFYLQSFYGNPYNVPIGGVLPYTGSTAPNSNFVLPYGQAISRTTYSGYFSLVSTTFGSGDGSATFNVPDLRGRVVAGADGMGGSAAGRLTDAVAGIDILGDAGGSQSRTLVTANLPPYTPSGSMSGSAVNFQFNQISTGATGGSQNTITGIVNSGGGQVMNANVTQPTFTGTAQGGTSTPVVTVQPTIVLNYLLRII